MFTDRRDARTRVYPKETKSPVPRSRQTISVLFCVPDVGIN